MPFAGISFLWFVGVIRDLLGEHEDQFFATVFFGSSLLFLAMVFVSSAIAAAILASANARTGVGLHQDVVLLSQAIMRQISNVYALRMASVFMMSLATIWLRTRMSAALADGVHLCSGAAAYADHQPQFVGDACLPFLGDGHQCHDPIHAASKPTNPRQIGRKVFQAKQACEARGV